MSRQVRKLFGRYFVVVVWAVLLVLTPFLAACGATPAPTAAPTTEPTEGAAPTAIVETVPVELTKVIVETVEVKKTVVVTRVPTQAAATGTPSIAKPTEPAAPTTEPTEALPPTPSSPGAVVQQELEKLASGLIAYNPPTEMTVDQTERVEVRIGMDTAAPLTTGLKGSGTPTVESIPVSCFMKVRLVGEAFSIVAFSSEEQIVPAQGFTEWAWDVTPRQSGDRILSLIVTALVKATEAEGEKDLPIIERQIHVNVNPGSMFSSFFRNNRGWIYPAVLLPLVAALGRWLWAWQKRRKLPADPGTDEESTQA
jgi:hypothetical protein